jgi:hypothetical protein
MQRILFTITLVGTYTFCNAQQLTSAGGGSRTMSGITITWSLGETIVANASNASIGFQQSWELVLIGVEEADPINLSVYPNPAKNFVVLDIQRDYNQELELAVYNLSGAIVIQKIVTGKTQTVELDIATLSSGPYEIILKEPGSKLASISFIKL